MRIQSGAPEAWDQGVGRLGVSPWAVYLPESAQHQECLEDSKPINCGDNDCSSSADRRGREQSMPKVALHPLLTIQITNLADYLHLVDRGQRDHRLEVAAAVLQRKIDVLAEKRSQQRLVVSTL